MDKSLSLQGKSSYEARKYKRSIPVFRQVLLEEPQSLDIRRLLASALYRDGSFEAAAKEYEIILRSDTLDVSAYHGLSAALAGKKKWEEAINSRQSFPLQNLWP